MADEDPLWRERFWQRADRTGEGGCWTWLGARGSRAEGVLTVRGHTRMATHVSWEIHRGQVPQNWSVRQTCGFLCCVNPEHLLLTRQRNFDNRKGEKHAQSKLRDKQVLAILRRLASGERCGAIAHHFRVSVATIWNIQQRKKWTHIQPTDADMQPVELQK